MGFVIWWECDVIKILIFIVPHVPTDPQKMSPSLQRFEIIEAETCTLFLYFVPPIDHFVVSL